jgi:hypothetical protein
VKSHLNPLDNLEPSNLLAANLNLKRIPMLQNPGLRKYSKTVNGAYLCKRANPRPHESQYLRLQIKFGFYWLTGNIATAANATMPAMRFFVSRGTLSSSNRVKRKF